MHELDDARASWMEMSSPPAREPGGGFDPWTFASETARVTVQTFFLWHTQSIDAGDRSRRGAHARALSAGGESASERNERPC